ncbi:MAG: TraB/GumN family protein [Vicinamibacterales bacterium]
MNPVFRRAAFQWMVRLSVVFVVAATPLAQTAPAQKGFIWKVERAGRTGWLVGSLHMLTPDAYPLPASMTEAFGAADTLMEEADPEELASPEFAASVVGRALYLDGQTLEDHVSADTFKLISERAAAAGLPLEVVRRMKPWMVATTLQAFELQRGGFDPSLGLDVHFHRLARLSSKQFVALETGLEQVSFLENLGSPFEDALVRENIRGAEAEVTEVRQIAAAWRAGDAAALEQLLLNGLKDSPAIYQTLIVSRNRAWLPKMQSCLDTARCFIVVGAGHLVGPDGLISALRARGYSVTQQ